MRRLKIPQTFSNRETVKYQRCVFDAPDPYDGDSFTVNIPNLGFWLFHRFIPFSLYIGYQGLSIFIFLREVFHISMTFNYAFE